MAEDAVRRSRARRTVVVALAAWLGVVVLASALAWLAIGRAGSEVLDPAAQRLPTTTGPSTATSGPTTSPTVTPPATTPPATTPPATSGTSAPPATTPADEVVTVTGGQAGFRCTGATLSLKFAQPDTGWAVSSSSSDGGARLRVEFESDGQRTRVEATCVDGSPDVAVETDGSGGDGGSGGGGDDD